MTTEAILSECWRRGVDLRADGDFIKYRPLEAVDDELRAAMLEHKGELLAELRRDAAVTDAWERLRELYARAGQPAGWLTADVLGAEYVVGELWVSSRRHADDDERFHVALARWERITAAAIEAAADGRRL